MLSVLRCCVIPTHALRKNQAKANDLPKQYKLNIGERLETSSGMIVHLIGHDNAGRAIVAVTVPDDVKIERKRNSSMPKLDKAAEHWKTKGE